MRRTTARKAANFEEGFFAADNIKSDLVELLLSAWVWGEISGVLIQRITQAASKDLQKAGYGKINSWILLSQMGTSGQHIWNIKRDLERKLPAPMFTLSERNMPVKVGSKTGGSTVRQLPIPLLPPDVTWMRLWKTDAWKRCILEDPSLVPKFLVRSGQHPALLHHPVRSVQRYQERAVPLILHGDGASVTQQIGSGSKSCLFVSFKSLLGQSTSCRERHLLVGAFWTHMVAKGNLMQTSRAFWNSIAKSVERTMADEGSKTDGFFGSLLFSSGDLEYFNAWHDLPHWQSHRPCAFCNIHLHDAGDYKPVPEIPPDQWNALPRPQSCPLFRTVLSPAAVSVDLMHLTRKRSAISLNLDREP